LVWRMNDHWRMNVQTKNSELLGDILEDWGLGTQPSGQIVSLFRARSRLVLHEASLSLYGCDLG